MGSGLARRPARQRPDLSIDSADQPVQHTVLLVLLAVDGVISAILGAFLLALHIGSIPFPIGALISGILNGALVWAGLQVTASSQLAAIALWTWLASIAVLILGGPGGDIVLGTTESWQIAVLLALGVTAPAFALWRHNKRC